LDELFPLLGGVVLALVASRFQPRLRWIVIVSVAPVIALTASWISGEFVRDWRFVLIDLVEVVFAAIAVMALLTWRRRAGRTA
jgi:hypothetical protein